MNTLLRYSRVKMPRIPVLWLPHASVVDEEFVFARFALKCVDGRRVALDALREGRGLCDDDAAVG